LRLIFLSTFLVNVYYSLAFIFVTFFSSFQNLFDVEVIVPVQLTVCPSWRRAHHPHPHPKAHNKTSLSNAPGHFSPVFKILDFVRCTYLNTLQVPVQFKMTTQISHYVKWYLCTMCCIKCTCQSRLCKPDYVLHYLACATYDCLVVLTFVILTSANFSPVRGLFAVLGSVLSTVLTAFYLSHDFYGLHLNLYIYIYTCSSYLTESTVVSNVLCSLLWKEGTARVFWLSTINFFSPYACTVCKGFIWNQQNQSSCHCCHFNRNATVDSLAKINATAVDGRRNRNSRAVTSHCSTATEQHWPSGSDRGRLHSAFRGFLQPVQAKGTVITLSRLGSCPYQLLLTIRRLNRKWRKNRLL